MQLELSPEAERDLESIGDHIARENPKRALSFVRELKAQCSRIAESPKIWRLRLELGQNLRSCAWGNYVIFFTETHGLVRIVRILHGAMDAEARLAKQSANSDIV